MINVNAAGCGKGKSTDNKALLTQNKSNRFLVIVPSLALANEYSDYGTVVTSDGEHKDNVKQRIESAIRANSRVLVITQKAFLDFERKQYLCTNRIILQDEHVEPLYSRKWQISNHKEWEDMFIISPIVGTNDWFEVTLNTARIVEFQLTEDMFDNKQFINDLISTPQRIITNKATIDDDSLMFRVISPEMYSGAIQVNIACANFTVTRQYHLWMNMFDVKFNIVREFIPYDTPNLTIHYAGQERNSKTFNTSHTYIRNNFLQYVKDNATDTVYVDNNVHKTIDGWNRVNHNCHGMNVFREKAHIAIVSAINYNNATTGFLKAFASMTTEQIRFSLIGEIAHQVAMRGSLRMNNTNICHIYVMETELAKYLYGCIFNNATIKRIDGTDRPVADASLTQAQMNKGNAIRKEHHEFSNKSIWSTEKLMKHDIWKQTSARGLYTKEYLQVLKDRLDKITD